jgi:hypothetical protein
MAVVSSLAFVLTGLFVVWRGQGSDVAFLGWMFVVIGALAAAFNVYVARHRAPGPDDRMSGP